MNDADAPEAHKASEAQDAPETKDAPDAKAAPEAAEAQDAPESQSAPETDESADTDGFAGLGLTPELVAGLNALDFNTPTDIQREAIPLLLAGKDMIGQAQTGTGKTAAFGLPLLQRLDLKARHVQAIVLTPTRELAIQVAQSMRTYADAMNGVRLATVYGGQPIYKQQQKLTKGVHIVVGTPGRVMDFIRRKVLKLQNISTLVLDEADEMLRMGFIDDVEWILEQTPETRQTALMSATMPPEIRRVASKHLREPELVTVAQKTRTVEAIDERFIMTFPDHKVEVLARVLETEGAGSVLIFCRTRAGCGELAGALMAKGFAAAALHGELSQAQREQVIRQLRVGTLQLVVATDVAARGLDIDDVTHVINFDPPFEPEAYVHRIGRTGRAGRKGVALTLFIPRERRLKQRIERFTRQRMKQMSIPDNKALVEGRIDRLKDAIVGALKDKGNEPYREALKRAIDESEASVEDLAVAAIRLASGDRPLKATGPEPKQLTERQRPDRPRPERFSRGHDRPSPRAQSGGPTAQIFIPLGRHAGIRPADLVGALANEAGVSGRAIGRIEIHSHVSFVEMEASLVQEVLASMPTTTIRGRRVALQPARPRPAGHRPPPEGPRGFKAARRPTGPKSAKPTHIRGDRTPRGKTGKKIKKG